VAVVIKTVKVKAVKEDKVKEVAIKVKANIKVEDTAIELEEEEVTITLIIGYYY
jgi:hypothetical protein